MRWRIAAGDIRPNAAATIDALAAQGGAFTLETVSPDGARDYARVTSIRRVVAYDDDLAAFVAIGAEPTTRIISFTATEAGYHLDATDHLDLGAPEIAADLEAGRRGRVGASIYAALAAILGARRAASAGAVTLLCCDNLRHNGDRSRRALLAYIDALGDVGLGKWVAAHTTSPNAMVDRITPRPTEDLRARVRAATGWDDAAPVMAESFFQWVIEDRFCNGRPEWERAGAQLVQSVLPYEEAKLRILNAGHSGFAWGGALLGTRFIHQGVADAALRRLVEDFVTGDVIACLTPSPLDLPAYRDVVFERFANAAIADTNQRVASDSFGKIPVFIAPTLRERLARDLTVDGVANLAALFLGFLALWHRGGLDFRHEDRAMPPAVGHAICTAADPVAALCAERSLWGSAAGDPRFAAALRHAADRVASLGAMART